MGKQEPIGGRVARTACGREEKGKRKGTGKSRISGDGWGQKENPMETNGKKANTGVLIKTYKGRKETA